MKDDIKMKQKTNLDRHGLKSIANIGHFPGPPSFSVLPLKVQCLCKLIAGLSCTLSSAGQSYFVC
jgi:hypothetical protein